jgi:hypothetical protein
MKQETVVKSADVRVHVTHRYIVAPQRPYPKHPPTPLHPQLMVQIRRKGHAQYPMAQPQDMATPAPSDRDSAMRRPVPIPRHTIQVHGRRGASPED